MKKILVVSSLTIIAVVSLFQISHFWNSDIVIIPFGYIDDSEDTEDIEVDDAQDNDCLSQSFEKFIEEHPTPFSKTIVKTEDD